MGALADLRALAEQALENPTLTTQGELHAFADARTLLALLEVAEAAQALKRLATSSGTYVAVPFVQWHALELALAGLGITAEETA